MFTGKAALFPLKGGSLTQSLFTIMGSVLPLLAKVISQEILLIFCSFTSFSQSLWYNLLSIPLFLYFPVFAVLPPLAVSPRLISFHLLWNLIFPVLLPSCFPSLSYVLILELFFSPVRGWWWDGSLVWMRPIPTLPLCSNKSSKAAIQQEAEQEWLRDAAGHVNDEPAFCVKIQVRRITSCISISTFGPRQRKTFTVCAFRIDCNLSSPCWFRGNGCRTCAIGEWCSQQQTYIIAKIIYVEMDRLWKKSWITVYFPEGKSDFGNPFYDIYMTWCMDMLGRAIKLKINITIHWTFNSDNK